MALQPVELRPPRFAELPTDSEVLRFPEGRPFPAWGFIDREARRPEAPLSVGFFFANGSRAFVLRREVDGAFLRPRPGERITRATTDPYFSPRLSYPLTQLRPWPEGLERSAETDRLESCAFSLTLAERAFEVILQIGHRIFTYERPIEELLFDPPDGSVPAAAGRAQPVAPVDLVVLRASCDPTLIRAAFQEHPGYLDTKLPGSDALPLASWAVKSERMDLLEVALELGAELNAPLPRIGCPLHVASSLGLSGMIDRLVEAGADPNVANLVGEMPLHSALRQAGREGARQRFLGIYDQLVRAGANEDLRHANVPSPRESRWLLAFHQAIKASDIEQARALLDDPIDKDGRLGSPIADVRYSVSTAFELAVSTGELEMVELLFPHTSGQSSLDAALWTAVGYRRLGTAAWLLEHGADSNRAYPLRTGSDGATIGGGTPLHSAAGTPNRRMAELLLNYGAHVNGLDRDGSTPLILASKRPFGHKTVALLIERGADLTLRDSSGKAALDYATQCRNSRTIEILEKLSE